MKQIPVNEAALLPYIGRTVQAKLKDGSLIYGKIKALKNGRIVFSAIEKGSGPTYNRLKKRYAKRNKGKARISWFFFGAAIALAFVAALFFVPFGFGFGGFGGFGGCGGVGCGGYGGGFY